VVLSISYDINNIADQKTSFHLRKFLLLYVRAWLPFWFLFVCLQKFKVGCQNLWCCCGCKRRPSTGGDRQFPSHGTWADFDESVHNQMESL